MKCRLPAEAGLHQRGRTKARVHPLLRESVGQFRDWLKPLVEESERATGLKGQGLSGGLLQPLSRGAVKPQGR